MSGFIKWFWDNLYSNALEIVLVLFSLLIPYLGSKTKRRRENRVKLKETVITPTLVILKKEISYENFLNLEKLSKRDNEKYMTKKEKRVYTDLISTYGYIARNSKNQVAAEILFLYFKESLKHAEVDNVFTPVMLDNEMANCEIPEGYFEFRDDLQQVLSKFDFEYETDRCQEQVIQLYDYYCKKYFSQKNISYFENCTLENVIKEADLRKEWLGRYQELKQAKQRFLGLKIAKKV